MDRETTIYVLIPTLALVLFVFLVAPYAADSMKPKAVECTQPECPIRR